MLQERPARPIDVPQHPDAPQVGQPPSVVGHQAALVGLPPVQEPQRGDGGPVEDLEHVVPVTVLVTTNLDGDAREFSLEPQDRGDGVDFYAVDERVHEVQDILLQHPVFRTLEKPASCVRLNNFYVFGKREMVQWVGMLNVVAELLKVDDIPLFPAEV